MEKYPKPLNKNPIIKSNPRVRDVYWCEFPQDSVSPELWKIRPVIVLSYKNTIKGSVTLLPCTTKDQGDNKCAINIMIGGKSSWVLCDKITTLSTARLRPFRKYSRTKIQPEIFNNILDVVYQRLPKR